MLSATTMIPRVPDSIVTVVNGGVLCLNQETATHIPFSDTTKNQSSQIPFKDQAIPYGGVSNRNIFLFSCQNQVAIGKIDKVLGGDSDAFKVINFPNVNLFRCNAKHLVGALRNQVVLKRRDDMNSPITLIRETRNPVLTIDFDDYGVLVVTQCECSFFLFKTGEHLTTRGALGGCIIGQHVLFCDHISLFLTNLQLEIELEIPFETSSTCVQMCEIGVNTVAVYRDGVALIYVVGDFLELVASIPVDRNVRGMHGDSKSVYVCRLVSRTKLQVDEYRLGPEKVVEDRDANSEEEEKSFEAQDSEMKDCTSGTQACLAPPDSQTTASRSFALPPDLSNRQPQLRSSVSQPPPATSTSNDSSTTTTTTSPPSQSGNHGTGLSTEVQLRLIDSMTNANNNLAKAHTETKEMISTMVNKWS